MRQSELEALAREIVPGEGAVGCELRGIGLVNRTYRLERAGEFYALRVRPAKAVAPCADWEVAVWTVASRAGLAPPVIVADAARGVLLTRWIAGRCWDTEKARSAAGLAKIAQFVRAIQALPVPLAPHVASAASWIRVYRERLGRVADDAAPRAIDAHADACLELLAASSESPLLCHGDLHVFNLLENGAALLALDWEFAHLGDRWWDLAGWCSNCDVTPAEAQALLHAYLGRPPRTAELLRLQALHWLYDYICWLWLRLTVRRVARRPSDRAASARAVQLRTRLEQATK